MRLCWASSCRASCRRAPAPVPCPCLLGLFLPRVLQARARTRALPMFVERCTVTVLPMLRVLLPSKRQALATSLSQGKGVLPLCA